MHNTIQLFINYFGFLVNFSGQIWKVRWRWLRIYTRDNDNSGTAEVTRLGRLLWEKVTIGNHRKSIFPSTVIQWCTPSPQSICIVSIYNNKQHIYRRPFMYNPSVRIWMSGRQVTWPPPLPLPRSWHRVPRQGRLRGRFLHVDYNYTIITTI